MKKLIKTLICATAMTMLFGVTCFAQEPTKVIPDVTPAQFMAGLAAHQSTVLAQAKSVEESMADKNAAQAHYVMILNQLKSYNRSEADNYITYCKKRVDGLKENERVKKEVVDNYTNLAKSNPYFASILPEAQAEYNAALGARLNEEALVNQLTAQFNVLYPR
jgi:hypothetical protein